MGTWNLLLPKIAAAAGPVQIVDLCGADRRDSANYETVRTGVRDLKRLGLVQCTGAGPASRYTLTTLGRSVAEGRAVVRHEHTGRGGRPRLVVAASWLSSLPQGVRIEPRPRMTDFSTAATAAA